MQSDTWDNQRTILKQNISEIGNMSPLLIKTDISYDIDRLNHERKNMKVEWFTSTQTGLQYASNPLNQYTDSCGSFTKRILLSGLASSEEDFTHIVSEYKGTLYETIMQEQNAYRTRILCRPKQTCYTVHTDVTKYRYHLALVTNPDCFVLYPDKNCMFHIPADGYVYRMITNINHTVANCGNDRYHLSWGSHDNPFKTHEVNLRYAGY